MISRERTARLFSDFFDSGGTVRQKAIRGTVWLLFSRWVTKPVQFIQTIVLARLLNPSDFGLMGLLWVVIGTIDVFVAPGMQSAIVQKKEVSKEALNTGWVVSILGAITKSVILFILAPYAALFYEAPLLEKILKFAALTYFIGGFRNIGMVIYRRDINMKMIAIAEQVTEILQAVATILLAIWLRNVWALVIGFIIGGALSVIVSYIVSPYRPSFKFDFNIARGLFRYGRHVMFIGIILLAIEKGDRALVGKVLDLDAVGYYTLAYGLAVLPSTFMSGVIGQILFPVFSRLHDQVAALRKSYLITVKFVSLIAIPASIGIGVLAPEIVEVVYGAKWLPMVNSLRVLCIFGMIRSIVELSGSLFLGTGKPHYLTGVSFAQLILMAVFLYPLTTTYHILGTSIAVAVPMVLVQGWALKKTSEIIAEKLSVILKILSLPLIGTVAMILILALVKYYFVHQTTLMGLLGLVVLGAVTYVCAIVLIDRRIFTEMKTLTRFTE